MGAGGGGGWEPQREGGDGEEKPALAGRCGPLAQSGRVGPSSTHNQGARASGRGISVPDTVFAPIKGQQARSDAVTSHLCDPEPALPPPWATVLSSASAADQMQLLLARPVRSSTTQSRQTNIRCQTPRAGALRRTRRRAPEHATSANRTATQTATGSVAGGGAPSPASPRAPSACGSTLPQPLAGPPPPALRPACQAFRGTTHLVAPRCTGDRAGCRGDARPAGEGAPLQAARVGRAGSREKELGRGRGGAAELPSSSLPPGRDPARGAVLGRGQRFFVSPAPSARHRGGGPHPGSGAGRFIRDINFSDYTRVRKRLNKL